MKMVLNVKDLAEALCISPATVRQIASQHPEKLPPRLKVPSRKLLWAVKDVEEWIEKHRVQQPTESKEGAPVKMVLDVKGLAAALCISPVTVRQNASQHPEKLPPRLKVPSRKLLWAVKDVEEWIEKHRAYSVSKDSDATTKKIDQDTAD